MCGAGADGGVRAAGEAKEKERAESGDAPTRDGLEEGTTAERGAGVGAVVERYHGLSALSETLKAKRDEAEPTLLPAPVVVVSTAAPEDGSNRSEAVRGYAVKDASSSESSKSSEHTAAVAAASSTNGLTPCTAQKSNTRNTFQKKPDATR